MRDDYPSFEDAGAQIVVIATHDRDKMKAYWTEHKLPYLGVPDPQEQLTRRYGQQWKLLKLGQMPAQFVVDCGGTIVYAHYGSSMSDIPTNKEMLRLIRALPPCKPAPAASDQ